MTYLKVSESLARGARALQIRAEEHECHGQGRSLYNEASRVAARDDRQAGEVAARDDRQAGEVLARLAADPRLIDASITDLANNPQLLKAKSKP